MSNHAPRRVIRQLARNAQNSPTFSPLYRQIKALMLHSLEAREWGPGDAIPSEAELAIRFNVSQGTVRKAIDEMAAENLLVRRQGKGTFVATHSDPRSFYRFLRLMPDSGNEASTSRSTPLSCSHITANAEHAEVFGITIGAPLIRVQRLLSLDDEPVVLDEILLNAEKFDGLDLETLLSWDESLYSLFESRFSIRMIRAEERLRAVAAAEENADLLGVAIGTPLLSVERLAFSYGEKPVEWRRGLYVTNHHHYLNELN